MRLAVVNRTRMGLSGGNRKYLEHVVPLMRSDVRVEALEVFAPLRTAATVKSATGLTQVWTSDGHLRQLLSAFRPDVAFLPSAASVPPRVQCPVVVRVQNMEPLLTPIRGNVPSEAAKNMARWAATFLGCRRARRVVAPSRHVRDFLVETWRIRGDKVGVVYFGGEPPIPRSEASQPPAAGSKPFIFTAGSIRPARGLEDLVRALPGVVSRRPDMSLVIAGSPTAGSSRYVRWLRTIAQEFGVDSRIRWAGQLTDREMAWCFRECNVFVTTSRAEAGPNTVLEAMGYGCLSVSTDQQPMPEFFQDAALYYRPRDPADLTRALVSVLAPSPAHRELMVRRAEQRAAQFSWAETAKRTVDEFQRAVGSG